MGEDPNVTTNALLAYHAKTLFHFPVDIYPFAFKHTLEADQILKWRHLVVADPKRTLALFNLHPIGLLAHRLSLHEKNVWGDSFIVGLLLVSLLFRMCNLLSSWVARMFIQPWMRSDVYSLKIP